jgi:hypothetical protein
MEAHITLYGQHAERSEEIQDALEDELGLDLSNAATVREMMARMETV